jgi:hypothetical protein
MSLCRYACRRQQLAMGRAILHDRMTQFAFVQLMAAVAFVMIWRPPDWFGRCATYVICVVATLLAGHAHNNYMLWWIPFFCILLSLPLSRILSLPEKTNTLSCADDERTQPD